MWARGTSVVSSDRTSIRFSVKVPVLSVAMMVTDPSASTADSRLTMAGDPGDPLDAEGEGHREDGRQPLRHRRHSQGHGKDDALRRPTNPLGGDAQQDQAPRRAPAPSAQSGGRAD